MIYAAPAYYCPTDSPNTSVPSVTKRVLSYIVQVHHTVVRTTTPVNGK